MDYQERNLIAREIYANVAKELAQINFRIDETIGLNATNAQVRESLRRIRSEVDGIIAKSSALNESEFELTAREYEILQFLNRGKSVKEICGELVLSEPTIKTHLANLYRKLQAKNRVEALHRAREAKLLED